MVSRKVYERFGGWPDVMQAWGGGENLFNFSLSVLGMNKWLMPGRPLYHDGAPRGYSYNNDGLFVNRLVAMYMIGGRSLADLYRINQQGNPETLARLSDAALANSDVVKQREHIEANQITDIGAWARSWVDPF